MKARIYSRCIDNLSGDRWKWFMYIEGVSDNEVNLNCWNATYKTQAQALSAARRAAKQLNLTVEE